MGVCSSHQSTYWKAGPTNLLYVWGTAFPRPHFTEQLLRVVSDESKVLVKGSKLKAEYKCLLFAEQKKEVLSENRKMAYYVLGEQFLSSWQPRGWTKREQFVSCDDSQHWQAFHFWNSSHSQLLICLSVALHKQDSWNACEEYPSLRPSFLWEEGARERQHGVSPTCSHGNNHLLPLWCPLLWRFYFEKNILIWEGKRGWIQFYFDFILASFSRGL